MLAALQAAVIYNIMLLFPSADMNSLPELDASIFTSLKSIISLTASSGLVLFEEASSTRPDWNAWIHVTSKRRAVYVLYLLHLSYSIYHGPPPSTART